MPPRIHQYSDSLEWPRAASGKSFLLLGNGFSMAYDRNAFACEALADHAASQRLTSPVRGPTVSERRKPRPASTRVA